MDTVVLTGLDRTVDRAGYHLPQALVSDAARLGLRAVAAQLSASLSNSLYFEAPLDAESRRVDLIVRVDRIAGAMLTRHVSRSTNPSLQTGPIWTRIHELAARWQSADSVLRAAGAAMWLEFDVEPDTCDRITTQREGCPPGVFFDFTPAAYSQRSRERRFELVVAALAPLTDSATKRDPRSAIRRCIDALPANAAISSVGVLLPRDASTIRLCVRGVAHHELANYLRAIGWPGSVQRLEQLIHTMDTPEHAERPIAGLIHLDVGVELKPRVGIEYRFRRRVQVRGVVTETAFLERLVREGLCAPFKRDAMLTWPGCSLDQMPHELWTSLVLRRINHIKLMYDDARDPHAKGYLCMSHAFRARPRPRPRSSDAPVVGMQASTQ
ncbi:MAG: hypothetical protein ABI625_08565 [bacterium]